MDNYSENKTNQTIFGVTKSISQFFYKLTAIPLSVILMLMLSPVVCTSAFAQEGGQTEHTHAHSESMKWKGIDVSTVIDNSNYSPTNSPSNSLSDYPFNKGKVIFLYNVGTGKFLIEGGNFGMEGRLFHETFGRPLYLFSDRYILSGIKENNQNKFIFGCNVPGTFHSSSDWNKWGEYSFTIMMDADKSRRDQGWQFERVETDTNSDTHTYYMWEDKGGKQYYLGAAYGECHASAWKGDGQLVFMDDDRAVWTTYDPRTDTTPMEVNDENIALNELYQWRLVDEDEFRSMLGNEEIGLNPSVSIFIKDRDFTRNSQEFSDSWLVEDKEGTDYTDHRYGFTYGSTGNTSAKQNQYNEEAWNKPIRLKHVFDGDTKVPYNDNSTATVKYGWKNAKYGFLTFEGVGRTYTEVVVPRPGWYLVQCYGFVQSNEGHDAYIFAKVKGSSETSSTGGEAKTNLKTVDAGTYTDKNLKDKCLVVGKELTQNGENYKNTVWICVTEEQFNDPVNPLRTLQIGVGKDEATQSAATKNGGKNYYYDTDWVCVDDFRMSYLGLRPAFFYEDEESLDYLKPGENKQYLGASPTGQYGGAICVERSMKTGQWNSFSFPLQLTGEQIRLAFGEHATLAKLHSVGVKSKNPNVIDFETVDLFTTEVVVEPGNFYLLKPTNEPSTGVDPKGNVKNYYELGRKFFSINNEPDTYTHNRLSTTTLKGEQEVTLSFDGTNSITAIANYVQTPDFANFRVSKNDGLYTGSTAQGYYAPKGSYVVSNNTIVHLNKDNPLKGFRGWIKLAQELTQESKDFTMEIFGIFDEVPEEGGTTSVPRIHLFTADESVYDLYGRKVGKLGDTLPKGIYIVKGKKYMVK